MPIEYPKVERMASGNLSLAISDSVTWESFPQEARIFLKSVQGRPLLRLDTGAERNWLVLVGWRPFFLVLDDLGMSLDSIAKIGNPIIISLQAEISGGHSA
jgi:hypothetical protein